MIDGRIISIYPNTIGFGYVILNEKGEIINYGIISIHPVNNEKCLKRIQEMISYYQPRILILKKYSDKSERVRKLIKSITDSNNENVKIYQYSREQIQNTFDVFGARNKYEISKKIVEAYPQLKNKLPEKRKPWEPENYYQGIFDAMALILVCQYINP